MPNGGAGAALLNKLVGGGAATPNALVVANGGVGAALLKKLVGGGAAPPNAGAGAAPNKLDGLGAALEGTAAPKAPKPDGAPKGALPLPAYVC